MTVRGFDHVAITVADVAVSAAFYRDVLGAEVLYLDRFESGEFPIASLVIGANRINLHPGPPRTDLVAAHPTPGAADLCFRWDGPIEAAAGRPRAGGGRRPRGPVGSGSRGTSVYFTDPDGNLLELLTTD